MRLRSYFSLDMFSSILCSATRKIGKDILRFKEHHGGHRFNGAMVIACCPRQITLRTCGPRSISDKDTGVWKFATVTVYADTPEFEAMGAVSTGAWAGQLVARLVLVTAVVIISPASSLTCSGGSEVVSGAGLTAIMLRWNGNIFWPPASKTTSLSHGSAMRLAPFSAQFLDADCGNANARVLPLEVDGNMVDLVPNPAKPGHPLEFQHRDFAGNVVKWTDPSEVRQAFAGRDCCILWLKLASSPRCPR